MRQFSNLLNGLVRSISSGKEKEKKGQEQEQDEVRKEIVLKSSGWFHGTASNSFVSVYSQTGQKGVNQDRFIVWEVLSLSLSLLTLSSVSSVAPLFHYLSIDTLINNFVMSKV
jgi:hypothetical protein